VHALIINYRNTDKPVCFVLSFVAFVTQAKNSMKYLCNSSSHNRNTENTLVKRVPQRLIIGKPISQYASYSAMFCLLHSNIGKEKHEKIPHPCNPSSHYGKYEEYTRERVPHISIRESHSISISAMSNLFHHIVLYIGIMKVWGFWPKIITPRPA